MTIFDGNAIWNLFRSNLNQAKASLAKLKVYCGKEPVFAGLSGWVFEQTIQYCIRRELEAQGSVPTISEQVSLGGRAKADLTVGTVAIEIKMSGLFGLEGIRRYRKYRKAANEKGLTYLFLTGGETYQPYRNGIVEALGKSNVFFLSDSGEWNRFVNALVGPTKKKTHSV